MNHREEKELITRFEKWLYANIEIAMFICGVELNEGISKKEFIDFIIEKVNIEIFKKLTQKFDFDEAATFTFVSICDIKVEESKTLN
jgi:hypothetical protein